MEHRLPIFRETMLASFKTRRRRKKEYVRYVTEIEVALPLKRIPIRYNDKPILAAITTRIRAIETA